MVYMLRSRGIFFFSFSFCVRLREGGGSRRGGVEVAFLSQVQNIPQRIKQISNTGLR